MRGKTILVAGGAGFVGSHLCARLVGAGSRVVCLDNLITGRKANIKPLFDKANFKFLRGDVAKPLSLKVHEIYHLASAASPPHYQRRPIETFKANVLGALNLLELAKKHRAKILLASTSEIYGDPLVHPQTERYWGNVNPVGIRSCYDESKRAAETLFMDFRRSFGVDAKIARIFNTYGPNMDSRDGRVVSNFIMQALTNKPLTIYGQGRQTRSFMYVDDLVAGMLRLMAAKNFSGPVNLGNPREFAVKNLAKKIVRFTGSRSRLAYKPLPQDDPRRRKPDITLAKKALGWQPKVSLDQGLRLTINYFRQIL